KLKIRRREMRQTKVSQDLRPRQIKCSPLSGICNPTAYGKNIRPPLAVPNLVRIMARVEVRSQHTHQPSLMPWRMHQVAYICNVLIWMGRRSRYLTAHA